MITFAVFGIRMRLASFTRDWLRLDLHVLTVLYVNIYISLVQCPRGKFRVILNVKRIKSSTKLKKKVKTNFMRRKVTLDFRIRNLAILDEMVE